MNPTNRAFLKSRVGADLECEGVESVESVKSGESGKSVESEIGGIRAIRGCISVQICVIYGTFVKENPLTFVKVR